VETREEEALPPPKKKLYDGLGGQIEVNWKLLKCESGEGWRK